MDVRKRVFKECIKVDVIAVWRFEMPGRLGHSTGVLNYTKDLKFQRLDALMVST